MSGHRRGGSRFPVRETSDETSADSALKALLSLLASAFLAAIACAGAAVAPNVAAQFDSVYGDFLHGSLDVAYARADAARTALARESGGERSEWSQRFRLLEAEVLIYQAKRSRAIELLACSRVEASARTELAIRRKLLCGLAHLRLNRVTEAVAEVRDARRLAEASDPALLGEVLEGEAQELLQIGKPAPALAAFRASLMKARERRDPNLEARDEGNIGRLLLDLGRHAEAIDTLRDVEIYARRVAAPALLQFALGYIGTAYSELGDFEKARAYFQQAESEAQAAGMQSTRADWLDDAGLNEYRLGEFDAALDDEHRALEMARSIDASEVIAGIETSIAFMLYQRGQLDAARQHSDAALAQLRGTPNGNDLSFARFVAARIAAESLSETAAERLLTGVLRSSTDPTLRSDIENALANLCAQRHDASRAEEWYRRSIKTFETRRAGVVDEELRLAAFGNGENLYRDYADFLVAADRPDEALQVLDRSRARTLDEGFGARNARGTAPTDPRALARRLDATLLFFSLGSKRSYLWVLTPQTVRLVLLPKESEINALVQSYQKTIGAKLRSSDPLRDANPDAVALYRTLVEPAAALIPVGSTVYVIPDGSLNGLNFETLLVPDGRAVHYWIEDVTLLTASSLRVQSSFAHRSAGASASHRLLLIGNPVSPRAEFPALPNARLEIERIVAHFPASERRVVTEAAAVPAVYAESDPGRFEYLHFVAHGTASRLSPLDSAVILSPSADDPDRFRLSARDIVKYPLRARLVTISTCFGSGSRAYAGEGLVGLAWAFLRAGSENVISALWEADDDATPQLMDAMYRELEQGRPPARALRSAKLMLLHSSGKNRKPLYWAPFQLYAGS
jgi:CHAT domain-containing protein